MNSAQRKFIDRLALVRPRTIQQLLDARFENSPHQYNLRLIGEGAFRKVFDVRHGSTSLDIVIKFPYRDGTAWSICCAREHACDEIRILRLISESDKYLALRRYMLPLLYADTKTGITVMPKHAYAPWTMRFFGFVTAFDNLLIDLLPEMRYEFDGVNANFGRTVDDDGTEHYVLLDAGLLGAWRKPRK